MSTSSRRAWSDREGLRVRAVERPEAHVGGGRLRAHIVEQVGQLHALPGHLLDPPPRDALEVAGERGLRQSLADVGEIQLSRPVDEPLDGEAVLRVAAAGQVAGDRVDPEPTGGRQQPGEAGAVLDRDRSQRRLHARLHLGAPEHASHAETEHPEQRAAPHRAVLRRIRHLDGVVQVHDDEGTRPTARPDGAPRSRRNRSQPGRRRPASPRRREALAKGGRSEATPGASSATEASAPCGSGGWGRDRPRPSRRWRRRPGRLRSPGR